MQQGGNLGSPVKFIRGIGPAKARLLACMGIETVRDLLLHFPSRYEDRRSFSPIRSLQAGQSALIRGKVTAASQAYSRRGRMFRATVNDGTGSIRVMWFKDWGVGRKITAGDAVLMYGRVSEFGDSLSMTHPEFEVVEEGEESSALSVGRIVPVHPLTEGISAGMMRSLVHEALERYARGFSEWLPERIRARRRLPDASESLKSVHFPSSLEEASAARKRFAYEELFLMQTVLASRRISARSPQKHVRFKIWPALETRIRSRIPFRLTGAQERVIAEICRDMRDSRPMNRLLQGDVGSGKTMVAAYAAMVAVANKAQAAFMAPTEILAEQHFKTLSSLLEGARVKTVHLGGGMSQGARARILDELASGAADVAVGTHALIQEDVKFRRLGLAVIDEQHRFGVRQRAMLRAKGRNPDVLVMTATPIPRTLTLTLFGDLDVSVIDEMPPGRRPPVTRWIRNPGHWGKAIEFAREQVKSGRQAFFVYPVIEESEAADLKSLLKSHEALQKKVFHEFRVGLLHGRMRKDEKEEAMAAFRRAEYEIMASTSVIEVGIDVPNATIMAVEDAHRFGLAQLHQLRGRIGRGAHDSYCFLRSSSSADDAARRLSLMERTSDGFAIADEDLRIRGPGEFFGTRQHGLPELKAADLIADAAILRDARQDAFEMLAADPDLSEPEHLPVKRTMQERLKDRMDLVGVG